MYARGPSLFLVSGLFASLVFGGCLADPNAATTDEHAMMENMPHSHAGMPSMDFALGASTCEEGGFVAAYPGMQKYADVWESTDIWSEIGKPMRTGVGTPYPGTGGLSGNWHMGYRCAEATVNGETQKNYIFGWVGDMVKAPDWDPGGADLHFLVSGIGFGNGTFHDAIAESTNADITHAYMPTMVQWYTPRDLPRSAAYVVYSDVEKGIYKSYSEMAKYRDFPARTVRLWWQVPADGSESHMGHDHGMTGETAPSEIKWNPVYWDITTTGGEQFTTPPVDSVELGCHVGIDDHGPQGGLCQPTLTNVYEHKSLTFTSGKVITGVTLDKIWTH